MKTDVGGLIWPLKNGKSRRIPKELSAWNEGPRKSDGGIFIDTHRGDAMIAATEKSTGRIVVAYHTEIFAYKR